MYLSVMNALIKLLLSQGNKINCLKGGQGRVRFPEKAVTDVLAHVLHVGFSGVNFCLGIRHKVFGDFFCEQCITFD